jgi:predicted acyl esterase
LARRLLPLLLAAALFCAWTANAFAFTKTDLVLPMSDGVQLGVTLYTPDGTPPSGGWPAVMLLHGLGKSRVLPEATKWSVNVVAENYLANQGYEVLTYDARAHGTSGGFFDLDGPPEVQDVRTLFDWLAARPEVDKAKIGGSALSYGGGALWLAAAGGVPFAALELAATWTDLAQAVFPGGLVKTGMVAGFLNSVPESRWDQSLFSLRDDLLHNRNLPGLRSFMAQRSVLPALDRMKAPVFLLQGRRDFAFDIAQATAAYQRLRGPKRLYIGDLGHAPAPDPEAEIPHYLTEGRMWFDRWLKGAPNGIDKQPPVELAPDPWTGKTVSYAGLPPTRNLAFAATGSQTVGTDGKVVRNLGATRQLVETFGSAVVRVSVKPSNGWGHLVAVLSAKPRRGAEIVVSDGGAAVSHAGTLAVHLLAVATAIPAGSQLRLTLASSSTAQSGANLLYLDIPQPPSAKLAVGRATVTIPVLLKPISQ